MSLGKYLHLHLRVMLGPQIYNAATPQQPVYSIAIMS